MRKQDMILMVITFGSMTLGVFLPFIGEPLAWFPRISMLCLLFVAFLSVDGREAWLNLVHYPLAVFLLVFLKLVIMPIACWGVFQLVLPDYALGAALVGGAATAVAAPFFAFMLQADFILVMVALVATSLLLPLVMPLVIAFLGTLGQAGAGMQVDLPVMGMMLNLSVMMLIPFVCAQVLRRSGPSLTARIVKRRQIFFLLNSCLSVLIIFSQYSAVILASPQYVFMAFVSACLANVLVFGIAAGATFWLPPAKQLAFVISCVAINNVVVLIMAVDFFSAPEALTTAMYAAPLFAALPLYRLLGRLRGHNPR